MTKNYTVCFSHNKLPENVTKTSTFRGENWPTAVPGQNRLQMVVTSTLCKMLYKPTKTKTRKDPITRQIDRQKQTDTLAKTCVTENTTNICPSQPLKYASKGRVERHRWLYRSPGTSNTFMNTGQVSCVLRVLETTPAYAKNLSLLQLQ